MTNCIDLIKEARPNAPKGSFYSCHHGRVYRLKRGGWKLLRNPWLIRRVERQRREAILEHIYDDLLRICEKAAAAYDAKQAVEADKKARADENRARARKHANKIRWGTDAEPGDTVTVEPLREPEAFEVTRVLGRVKHDAKAGEVVELDMDNPPTNELPRELWDARQEPHGWAKVENSEDYKPRRPDTFVDLEGSPNLLTEKPKASGGVISAEHDHFKGSVKIEVHGVRGDAAEVMEQAAASIRENGARGVWL
ncbi:hypothetical protein SEA_CHOCOLAT_78 [Arthrobacter phage Chocolat]|uniref:Uncharacterized protein n=5 Tax=Klausavirus princesstrina TaxID=1984784 RepID=A0A1J0GRX3_9CAUD|nr:hypothetical protein SEA_CHOCOLAT_78 [Arthrobacter phage Chocolat]APC44872.1 hypothetical protein SEA_HUMPTYDUMPTY_78 [Arthrobacter phage HumptyDumpty]ASX98862.1 hypothetical protein SEA_KABREEZE_78 [Arthrobacter phage Kabreeze]ASX99086.1 hypothetical protein SEA_SCAVITO_79 [Arthrobacter phage Scavito]QEQ94184.1 hypothetical protein SEA_MORDRED_78 [Arthrobacter phage Mordred]